MNVGSTPFSLMNQILIMNRMKNHKCRHSTLMRIAREPKALGAKAPIKHTQNSGQFTQTIGQFVQSSVETFQLHSSNLHIISF